MKQTQRIQYILSYLEKYKECKTADILELFKHENIERTTIYRDLKFLLEERKIKEIGRGKYKFSENPLIYIEKPFYERKKV